MIRMIVFTALFTGVFCTAYAPAPERSAEQTQALEIYSAIIAMRTASGHGKTPQMAAYLASQLKSAGFSDEDVEVIPSGETAALVARYRGDGSSDKKPILFLAHMDVVDADPASWDHDPFTLREEDGYFYGRGTTDNKDGVANLTHAFIELKQRGFVPTRDLYLVFSGDEETDMSSTRMLAARKDLLTAEFALNSDAGGGALRKDGTALSYSMQAAEKTYATFNITAQNSGGHSSRPRRDNAIYDLVDALAKIRAYEFPARADDVTRAYMRATAADIGGALGKALTAFAENPKDKKAIRAIRADDRYAHLTSTTCIATMLKAGHAENALPRFATATVNCRIFPGVEIEAVRSRLADIAGNEALEIAPVDDYYVASPPSMPREDVTTALETALRTRYPSVKVVPAMSSGATDGMFFRRAGVPTFGVGAGFSVAGESGNAHGENEHLRVESFFAGLDHWLILIKELAGPSEK